MPDITTFTEAMEKLKIPHETIDQILGVEYLPDKNPGQENANFYAKAMPKCLQLLGFDTTAKIMYDRACCKSGYRLANAKQLSKEHGSQSLPEKLQLLGSLKYMGHPFLNQDGDIVTFAVGSSDHENMSCPCWRLKGCRPAGEKMPLAYCLCCAGHFMFHYQKALDLELKVKDVVSSIINSEGKLPCVFIFEIVR
jgi:hypothetical protein